MRTSTRRETIAGLLGIGGSAFFGLQSRALLAHNHFPLPPGPMRLTRRLERGLRDNSKLVINRSWRIQFERQGRGIKVAGAQLHAEVDAPTSLAPLAAIEETRNTADMWPILLSDEGRILASGNFTREEDLAAAVKEAEQVIAERPVPVSEQEALREYLGKLDSAGSALLNTLPEDLFFPIGEPLRMYRTVDLPSGLTGEFEVSYLAQPASPGGWLERAERQVVTRIGQDERRASELWMLSQL